jgi:6-phosphofructokinase 1
MNALVVQCGGPTAVINASLAAVMAAWGAGPAARLWGARLGLQGLVAGDWAELTALPATLIAELRDQPGAALGSSRYWLADDALPGLLERLAAHAITALFFIGGNGTMHAAQKVGEAAAHLDYGVQGQPLRVIGIPKTVDNDLPLTEVAPGYGSAARFIAQTVRDIGLDLTTMRTFDDVAVLEVMGRHAGWLAAAAALARAQPDDSPDLILLPEVVFDEDAFLARVHAIHQRKGICLVVAAEGIRTVDGRFVAERGGATEIDASGQKMLGLAPGVAPALAALVRQRLGVRCRHLRPDTIQRSSSGLVSTRDRALAELVGRAAVEATHGGHSGVMIGVQRTTTGWTTQLVPLADLQGKERPLPAAFIDPTGWGVTPAFIEYAQPIVGELARTTIRL